jgi:hypothetical protein
MEKQTTTTPIPLSVFTEKLPGPQRLSQPHFWLFREVILTCEKTAGDFVLKNCQSFLLSEFLEQFKS